MLLLLVLPLQDGALDAASVSSTAAAMPMRALADRP
jgi:hypothetical protein